MNGRKSSFLENLLGNFFPKKVVIEEKSPVEEKFSSWIKDGWRIYHVSRSSGDLDSLKKGKMSFEDFKKIKYNDYFLKSPSNISYPLCKNEIDMDYTQLLAEEFGEERKKAKEIIEEITSIRSRPDQYKYYMKYLSGKF